MCSESKGTARWGSGEFCCLPEDIKFLMRSFVQKSHSTTQKSHGATRETSSIPGKLLSKHLVQAQCPQGDRKAKDLQANQLTSPVLLK